jgi:predicted GNAT superfamily acetyltransferase
MDEIIIRAAESTADYRALQEAQRRVWGVVDETIILPVATMASARHHGGFVAGAFSPDGTAVGVSFGFLGRIEGRLCLYSQLTGVVPGHQSRGLGMRLKEAQRDFCRAEGIALIAWAFDPMQAGNAHFNLQKLGATSRRLVQDMYGPRTDALNAGVRTDRLIAEWEIDAVPPPVLTDDEARALPRVLVTPPITDSERREMPPGVAIQIGRDTPWSKYPEGPRFLLEVPSSIAEMRRDNPDKAMYWQAIATSALIGCFEMGYSAVGFVRTREEGEAQDRSHYVLERQKATS